MIASAFIIEILNCLFEAGIIIFYLYQIMKRSMRYPAPVLLIPFTAVSAILIGLTLADINPWIKLGVLPVIMMAVSLVLFENKIGSTAFYCLIFTLVILASEILPMGALMLMNLGDSEARMNTGMGRYIGMAASKLFCFWFSIYTAEYLKPKQQQEIPLKNWLLIIFVPLLSLIILNGIYVSYGLSHRRTIVYLLSVAGIFLLNILVFDFFDTYSNTIKLRLMEQRLQSEEENYKLIENKYTEIRQLKHDISNQLSAVKRMFCQGESPDAVIHLDKLYSKVSDAGGICYTGISSVDAIVNMKWSQSVAQNIPFSCKVIFQNKMDIDELPLCRIIANLLDNAIEGAQRSDAGEKYVYISLIQSNRKLRICVINTSDEVNADDLNTKKSGYGHGIGISSIRDAVEQLDGILSLKCEKGIFTADIMIAYQPADAG